MRGRRLIAASLRTTRSSFRAACRRLPGRCLQRLVEQPRSYPSWPPPCSSSWSATCSPGSSPPSSARSWNGSGSTAPWNEAGIKQALARSKYDPSDIIAKLAFWLIFLVALQIAFGVFGPNPISDLLQGLIAYLPNVLVAIVIIVVAAAIAKAATDLLSNLLSSVSGGQVMAKGAGIAVLVFGPSPPWTSCRSLRGS